MKKKLKLYIETTLFNYFFDEDRDAHADTVRLFKEIKAGKYEAYTSIAVTDELNNAPSPKKEAMLALIKEYTIVVFDVTDEARNLTDEYIAQGIIPSKYRTDGTHIAAATVNDMDAVVSLNFQHIVKVKVQKMSNAVNILKSYRHIKITEPREMLNDENTQHN